MTINLKNKTLHIAILEEKFILEYINFVDKNVDSKNQYYLLIKHEVYNYDLVSDSIYNNKNVETILYERKKEINKLFEYMKSAKKIILHGLWKDEVVSILYNNQFLLKKSYWIMWGGDFYSPENQSYEKKEVMRKISFLITGTKGDYDLAKKWYFVEGKYIGGINYPSNIYRDIELKKDNNNCLNIQVGNSADPTNKHFEIFEKLEGYKSKNIKIFVPLSYGDKKYAKEVFFKGKELFGRKFIAILNHMSLQNYNNFLNEIDIAIFNHERQQAAGNIFTLLGLGKTVYLNEKSTLYKMLDEYGFIFYNIKNLELKYISLNDKNINKLIMKKHFSKEAISKNIGNYLR